MVFIEKIGLQLSLQKCLQSLILRSSFTMCYRLCVSFWLIGKILNPLLDHIHLYAVHLNSIMFDPTLELLNQPMSRRQFLFRLGLLVLVLSGLSSTFDKLQAISHPKKLSSEEPHRSFGSGAYGA
jgi:hypothetical protein